MDDIFQLNSPLWRLPATTGNSTTDVKQLVAFADRLFHPEAGRNYYVQIYLCVALVFVIMIGASLTVGHRILMARAWLLKKTTVTKGTFYTPNSVMAFLGCETVFLAFWIAYSLVCVRYYQNEGFPKSLFLWRILVWSPLWTGAWWTAFGILSAFPDAAKSRNRTERQLESTVHPLAINVACWATPLVQISTVLPLAVLAATEYNAAVSDFKKWRGMVLQLNLSSLSPHAVTLIQNRVLQLWTGVVQSYWYYSIAMACWAVWSAICLALYVPAGARTLRRIRTQLQHARERRQSSYHTMTSLSELPHTLVVIGPALCSDDQCASAEASDSASICSNNGSINTTEEHTGIPKHRARLLESSHRLSERSLSNEQQERICNLQRMYRNLRVQYYAIIAAIACFTVSAIYAAAMGHRSARENKLATLQIVGDLLTAWIIVVFGFLTMCCVFWRTFDLPLGTRYERNTPNNHQTMPVAFRRPSNSLTAPKLVVNMADRCEVKFEQADNQESVNVSRPAQIYSTCRVERPGLADEAAAPPSGGSALKPSEGSRSLSEYPSLYFVTPFGKVPASTDGLEAKIASELQRNRNFDEAQPTRGLASINAKRPLPDCNLLAEHGCSYKPAASSFGQWRQGPRSPPRTSPIDNSVVSDVPPRPIEKD